MEVIELFLWVDGSLGDLTACPWVRASQGVVEISLKQVMSFWAFLSVKMNFSTSMEYCFLPCWPFFSFYIELTVTETDNGIFFVLATLGLGGRRLREVLSLSVIF